MKKVRYRLFQIDRYHNRQHLCRLSNAKQVQSLLSCVTKVRAAFYLYSSYLTMEPLDPFEKEAVKAPASDFLQIL